MGLSRNKVAVPEGAAGSPPFYGEFSRMFVRRCAPRASHGAMAAGLLVWKTSLALPCRSCGGCGVVWMRFWAPGSPPQAFAWRDSMPVVPAGRPCAGLVGVAVRGGLRTG